MLLILCTRMRFNYEMSRINLEDDMTSKRGIKCTMPHDRLYIVYAPPLSQHSRSGRGRHDKKWPLTFCSKEAWPLGFYKMLSSQSLTYIQLLFEQYF